MDKCIEYGHAFEVMKNVKVNEERIKQTLECRDCGYDYEDFIGIDEVNPDMILLHCDEHDEDYEQDEECGFCKDERTNDNIEYDPKQAHKELLQTLADIRKDHNWSG